MSLKPIGNHTVPELQKQVADLKQQAYAASKDAPKLDRLRGEANRLEKAIAAEGSNDRGHLVDAEVKFENRFDWLTRHDPLDGERKAFEENILAPAHRECEGDTVVQREIHDFREVLTKPGTKREQALMLNAVCDAANTLLPSRDPLTDNTDCALLDAARSSSRTPDAVAPLFQSINQAIHQLLDSSGGVSAADTQTLFTAGLLGTHTPDEVGGLLQAVYDAAHQGANPSREKLVELMMVALQDGKYPPTHPVD